MNALVAGLGASQARTAYALPAMPGARTESLAGKGLASPIPDEATISLEALAEFGRLQESASFKALLSIGADSPYQTLGEVESYLAEDLAGLEELFSALFASAGIDTGQPFNLIPDGTGGLRVGGEHPQAGEIQALVGDNPLFASRLAVAGARASLVGLAERNPAFRAAYEEDPAGAVETYIDELAEGLYNEGIVFENGSARAPYELDA
jgi:hypothetical protein